MSDHATDLFDNIWLCYYPQPFKIMYDNVGDFIGLPFKELPQYNGIKEHPTTIYNPREKVVAKGVHLAMANMLRTMVIEEGGL